MVSEQQFWGLFRLVVMSTTATIAAGIVFEQICTERATRPLWRALLLCAGVWIVLGWWLGNAEHDDAERQWIRVTGWQFAAIAIPVTCGAIILGRHLAPLQLPTRPRSPDDPATPLDPDLFEDEEEEDIADLEDDVEDSDDLTERKAKALLAAVRISPNKAVPIAESLGLPMTPELASRVAESAEEDRPLREATALRCAFYAPAKAGEFAAALGVVWTPELSERLENLGEEDWE